MPPDGRDRACQVSFLERDLVSVRPHRSAARSVGPIVSALDSGHYGRLMTRRTKGLWTDEEKRSICLQTTSPGASVAQLARRYAMNANMIFKWLRNPR
jgi:hypothetical protein